MAESTELEKREYARLVVQETLIFDVAEEICRVMDEQQVPRQELAARLGKSKSFVTQVLSGERNMTLRTLADLAFVLNHEMTCKFNRNP